MSFQEASRSQAKAEECTLFTSALEGRCCQAASFQVERQRRVWAVLRCCAADGTYSHVQWSTWTTMVEPQRYGFRAISVVTKLCMPMPRHAMSCHLASYHGMEPKQCSASSIYACGIM